MKGTLYIVPTPIGNLEDITLRALRVLNEVDYIYAEDTRVTKILLSHFNINKPQLLSYHLYNEQTELAKFIQIIVDGSDVALVSDAGMPGISDPGYLLISEVIKNDINVVALPGASAFTTALVASGLPTNSFLFVGFLNYKKTQKEKELNKLKDYPETLIFYESPHRIVETLKLIEYVLGNRRVVIARELTKKYEEYIRGNISDVLKTNFTLKGEFVVIVEGANIDSLKENLNSLTVLKHYEYYIDKGYSKNDAMKLVASDRKVSKSVIYKELL